MMRKNKEDCRYFNFPITLLQHFLHDRQDADLTYCDETCYEDIWNYALYAKAQEYTSFDKKHEKIQEALSFYNVKYTYAPTNKTLNEVYNGGEELYFKHKGNAMTSIETGKYFEYKNNNKSNWDKIQLLGMLAIKSIIGESKSKKVYRHWVLSRMDGSNNYIKDITTLSPKLIKHFPTINDAGDKIRQAAWNKFIDALQDNWYLKYQSSTRQIKVKGFYVGFNTTQKALKKMAIAKNPTTKKQLRLKKDAALEREIMEELGLIEPTQEPKPTKPQEEPIKEVNKKTPTNINHKKNNILLDGEQIDLYILQLKTQELFLEGLYNTHKFRPKTIGDIASRFKEHLKMFPSEHKTFMDFRNHFASWISHSKNKGSLGEFLKYQKGEL